MSKMTQDTSHFLTELLKYQQASDGHSSKISRLNEHSSQRLKTLSFPQPRDEEWRFTNLKPLTQHSFVPVSEADAEVVADVDEHRIPEAADSTVVLVNGRYSKELSSIDNLPKGVVIGNLNEHADQNSLVHEHLNNYAEYDDDVFVAFNGAFTKDGVFISIPKETKVEAPIHLLHVYTDAEKPYFVTPRVLVHADRYSKATIFEDHIGLADNVYFNVPVGEYRLEEAAYLKHVKIQRDSQQAVHFGRPVANLAKYANYESYTITRGALLSRNDPKIIQSEPEVTFTLDGLVLIDNNQISDTHSTMDHRYPHVNSHQLHKCVIEGRAHSVFNGKIFVRKDAQKIDSFQENRNLLLSQKGQVNTKPQLEIFADDVVCTHGATIGQMEDEELFYLQSRGLSKQKAKELLTYAFALETIENIQVESVNELLKNLVQQFTAATSEESVMVS